MTHAPAPSMTNERWLTRWFVSHGYSGAEAVRACGSFLQWMAASRRVRQEQAAKHELVARTANLHISAIRHYWSPHNWQKLSDATLLRLDAIIRELGESPPQRRGPRLRIRGGRRIALLTELQNIPSPRYHLDVIRSITEAAEALQFSVSIHGIARETAPLASLVRRVINHARPHAIVWLRLTPDEPSLGILYAKSLPTVLVHCALAEHDRPVLGHVVPLQAPLGKLVEQWAGMLQRSNLEPHAVIATMPLESGSGVSIRDQRVKLIGKALTRAGLTPLRFMVPDYSACNALAVVESHPSATGYACLSDELAVAVKHLLLARGRPGANGAVLGFDASRAAGTHGIASIDQHLESIGRGVAELLANFFQRNARKIVAWPPFREIGQPVTLQLPREIGE